MTAQSTQTVATETTEATAPQHGAEVIVPLNRLKASPKNARKTPHSAATIEAFAASIKAKGVLQPPVVEVERDGEGVPTGNYLVTIGEGRRQGLRLLAKRKAIKRTHPVRCIVDAENDAHEISLDENMTREAMHPADQFEAFQRLAEERGYGAEEIGARFGVSAHVVRQRLRLQADVNAALATVVHALVLQVFYPGYGVWTPLQLRLTTTGLERLAPGVDDGPAGRRVRDRCEAWGARLPERPQDLWGVVAALAPSDQLDLMACCAGVGLYAVRDPHDRRPGALAQAETLATAVGLDMTGTWSATAASYFTRVAKPKVLEAVTEAAGAQEAGRIAGFKKADMAEAAERLVEGKGWLPAPLRTVSDAAEPEEPGAEAPSDDDAYSFAAE